jgi:hypothetical protein
VLEYQLPFIQALRVGPKMRTRMFGAIEQGHAPDFWRSSVGRGVYDDLLSAVRQSGVPDAVEEFEDRFSPLLTSKQTPGQAEADDREQMTNPDTALENRRTSPRPGILAVCLAAAVSALIIGINVVRTSAEPPKLQQANSTAAKPAVDRSDIVSDPEQAGETQEVPDTLITESGSETTSEPQPAVSLEQSPLQED